MELSNLFWDLGRWAGGLGFLCLSLLIFSGETARFFDRYFGLDRIIKFQRKFSLFTALFVVFHPIFFILSSGSITDYIIPDFSILPFALGPMAFYIFVIIMIASQLYKRISYNVWQYLHILTYVLFAFGLYHGLKWGSDSDLLHMKILYGLSFTAIVVGIIYRTQYKIRQRLRPKFYVKELKQETKEVFTLVLKSSKKLKFKAGQFCFLRLNKNKLYARHPFTISSSPQMDDLHFTIKIEGRFTKTAAGLKEGDRVIVDGPFGNFVVEEGDKPLVFIAGGVGITPFMSLIQDQIDKDKSRQITLFYGSRTKDRIIFKDRLEDIKASWFKLIHIMSQEDPQDDRCEYGYINKDTITKHISDIENSIFYICGPEAMKNCAKDILKDLGVKNKNIKIEDFFW